VLLREPGGVELSERIRELVRNPGVRMGARAEALLYAAARAELVDDAIRPRLEHGGWILLDRFVDSSLAYQGGGRELGIDAIARLNRFATGNLIPDRTLLLEIDTDAARARAGRRGSAPDRLELEDDRFFRRIAAAYRELAEREPERIRTLDATLAPDELLQQALHAIADLLEER
jgi:dTMP kinase